MTHQKGRKMPLHVNQPRSFILATWPLALLAQLSFTVIGIVCCSSLFRG